MYGYAPIFSLRKPVKYESVCALSLSSKSLIMILKVTFESGYQTFTDLGKEFGVIGKYSNPEGFKKCAEEEFLNNIPALVDECYSFIFSPLARRSMPLYKEHENIILNENGSLFMNMTYK